MRSQSSLCGSLVIGSILVLCMTSALAGIVWIGVEKRAVQKFGSPDPGIPRIQRLFLSVQLLLQEDFLNLPKDKSGTPRPFSMKLGEATATVIDRLEQEGLIGDSNAFRVYLLYRGIDTSLQAGDYELSPGMTAIEIAHALQDATPTHIRFNILAGWRLEEIAQALPTSGLQITSDAFLAAAHDHPENYSFSAALPDNATLEGFLFPGEYQFRRDVSIDEFYKSILENFDRNITPEILQGFNRQQLDTFGGVTLASIIEREAVLDDEMPLIASVFLNRLAANMKLDSDPTIQYGLGYNPEQLTWWTNPLSLEDLSVDSPFNTYLYAGLPPGPISNPGPAALRAVAFPAQSPYYFFRAACDGSGKHQFATTFEEHVANACP